MMTTLPTLITDFFMTHLAQERNVSGHTVMAYRDTLKMLLCFAAKFLSRTVDHLNFEHLSVEVILEFLNHLENVRRNTVRSRNARLAAIHSFFRYVLGREPALASLCQRVLIIPFKKSSHQALGYLSEEEVSSLLSQVDRSTLNGERDYLLLALLYDTGGRVHEVLNLRPIDFRLDRPAFVRISGKGRRERLCPLLPQTARIVGRFVTEQGRHLEDTTPLFMNRSGQKLSRHGVRYLIRKYVAMAQEKMPCMGRPGISPHSLRHAKAMHLLQSGSPLTTIKDILGHADIKSTEVYVQADLQMKRKALELVGTPTRVKKPKASIPLNLLKWLESL
jgi:site-specific recombinase XerD